MYVQQRSAAFANAKVKKLNEAAEIINEADALLKQATSFTKKAGKASGSKSAPTEA